MRSFRTNRAAGAAASASAYVVALVVAVLVVRATGLTGALVQTALGTLVGTVVIFAASVALDNSSMYDPYWSLQPVGIAGYYVWTGWGALSGRLILVTVLALLYAARLTSNFYRDWPGLSKEDFRYVGFRRSSGRLYWPVSFLGIHLFPTIMVFLGCLPVYAVSRDRGERARVVGRGRRGGGPRSRRPGLRGRRADAGLPRRPAQPGAEHPHRAVGLQPPPELPGRDRHLVGMVAVALAASPRWWWTVIGAAAITVMFVLVSVPMMEKRALATREGYREYREQTPMLLPWPRRRGQTVDARE